jgi:2-polyprenyl-6-methoxyphenol hydroxylase-like FAD-dependent oxidoreductase
MEPDDVPVLIVGGSLVGLTLAALLGQYGIKGCLVVEKHSSTAIHPRATVMMRRYQDSLSCTDCTQCSIMVRLIVTLIHIYYSFEPA